MITSIAKQEIDYSENFKDFSKISKFEKIFIFVENSMNFLKIENLIKIFHLNKKMKTKFKKFIKVLLKKKIIS